MAVPDATILIDVQPIDAEDEDMETVALASDLLAATRQALAAEPGYVVTSANDGARSHHPGR